MGCLLHPDMMFARYTDATAELLTRLGVRALICDIDNTLAPYSVHEPDDSVRAWCKSLTDAGIGVAFVSNNKAPRVLRFTQSLGLPAFPDCKKPFGAGIRNAARALGADKAATAMLGDQLFTDVLAARLNGFRPLLVTPIEPIENRLFYIKRALERPILARWRKKHADKVVGADTETF